MAPQQIGDRYRLTRKVLSGDALRGLPELWKAQDGGEVYYVKIWKRRPGEAGEIQALWNREVRSLMRLQGYPGAGELFVGLRGLDANNENYYAILDGGRRELLSEVLQNRSRYHWLLNLSEVGRRRPLWEGLLRIAEGVAILHSEGTLHRSLSPASIFVGPDGDGDFRLSGFEWALRLAGNDGSAIRVQYRYPVQAPEVERAEGEYSPGTDWFDFGLLAAELFGAPVRAAKKRNVARAAIDKLHALRESEKAIIRQLIAEDPEERLADSEAVTQSIRNIIRDLNVATGGAGRDLVLAVRLAPELELQKMIEAASNGIAKAVNVKDQRDWIAADLSGDIRVIARLVPYSHFILKGEKLEYRVRPWSANGSTNWHVGFCESVEQLPRSFPDDQYFSTGERKVDVQLFPHVRKHFQQIRDRSAKWDQIFSFRKSRGNLPGYLRDVHDFFRITQQLDTVLTAAQICPVHIVSSWSTATETVVELTPLDEAERNDLARQLGLQSPAEQLKDWFNLGAEPVVADDEDDPKRDSYSLLERRTIGNENSNVQWFFTKAEPHRGGPRYLFRTAGSLRVRSGRAYLARNHGGTVAQIRRRHKAIEELRSHETLLKLIADPISISRQGSDKLPKAKSAIKLDDSKLAALKQLWVQQPSFAIQGPPGTGKTTLIKAFGDRLFHSDRSAQVLITAHSHHTVDDVRIKLSDLLIREGEASSPILLRLGAREKTEHDVDFVTGTLLRRLANSQLAAGAPEFLKARLLATLPDKSSEDDGPSPDLRTMQILIQDAANLTFATSNSAELAELADRGRRFDWSVIEEAGKAHGFDMAVALQESHRLLLIGDHHQLPPFNARLFKTLLADPLRVRKAIQTGVQFAPGLIDASLVEDEDGRDPFEERCSQWRHMVTLFGSIFEKSILGGMDVACPAATLTDQHRMHPDIADLVGRIFYPNEDGGTIIRSPDETHLKFAEDPPFSLKSESWLSEKRIVWCDVPWVQKKEFSEGEIDGLFISRKEADVVVDVLEEILPREDKECEIQILSPYNGQLEAIREAVDKGYRQGRLPHMFREPFNLKKGKRLGATVDEFQGSEADIVIVSLVRNNALVAWKSVGFLKESNRMNVLLSRARQKLIVVGSWDFFASRCDEHTTIDDEYAYIGRMIELMKSAENAGLLARVERL
jgi:serine/threonine protein kinase